MSEPYFNIEMLIKQRDDAVANAVMWERRYLKLLGKLGGTSNALRAIREHRDRIQAENQRLRAAMLLGVKIDTATDSDYSGKTP